MNGDESSQSFGGARLISHSSRKNNNSKRIKRIPFYVLWLRVAQCVISDQRGQDAKSGHIDLNMPLTDDAHIRFTLYAAN
jgi:hypothetical protein